MRMVCIDRDYDSRRCISPIPTTLLLFVLAHETFYETEYNRIVQMRVTSSDLRPRTLARPMTFLAHLKQPSSLPPLDPLFPLPLPLPLLAVPLEPLPLLLLFVYC